MRKLIIIVSIVLFSQAAKAQLIDNTSPFSIDVLGGVGVSSYFGDDITENNPILRVHYGARVGYQALKWLAFETGYGHSVLGTNENNQFLEITHTVSYNQIPFLARLSYKKLSLGLGVEYNSLQDVELVYEGNYDTFDEGIKELYNSSLWNAHAGVKLDVNYYSSLALEFSYGLSPILKEDFDWKAGVVRLSYYLRVY